VTGENFLPPGAKKALPPRTSRKKRRNEIASSTARRTLQRELKELVDNGILAQEGATNRLVYRLKI
jgi:predicted HTH transcriptional regulator